MPKKPSKDNPRCPICRNIAVKNGQRENRLRKPQRYLCKSCRHSFIQQPKLQKSKTYPLTTILNSISTYNLGTPLRKIQIPKSTLHNWIKNFNLPLNRLRKTITQNPIIKQRFIHHQQPFMYQYHNQKLQFARKFPGLINYLKNINNLLPEDIFKNSERISRIAKQTKQEKETPTTMARRGRGCSLRDAEQGFFEKKTVEANVVVGVSKETNKSEPKINYATKLAEIALSITNDNKERHNIIENFMLINDTVTIATEIPVYIKEDSLNQNLTGHIDILQIRYHKIYILDYKPEPFNKQQAINQLRLYRKALSEITSIPKHKFKLAFFNDNGYSEISA